MNLRRLIGKFMMRYFAGKRRVKVLPGRKHLACIGDSITFGAGVRGKAEETYEYFLNEKLGEAYQVLNYGASGRTLSGKGDQPYIADRLYKDSLNCQADCYLILLGTNDAKPHNWHQEVFAREYVSFVESYTKLPQKPKVILLTPPHCFAQADGRIAFDIDSEVLEKEIVPIIRAAAADKGLQLIDLFSLSGDHPEWFADGVHPNRTGNEAIAEIIYEQLGL